MSDPQPFSDSIAFRAGQQHMARHIAEALRQRRELIYRLPAQKPEVRATAAELGVIIRMVDSLASSSSQEG